MRFLLIWVAPLTSLIILWEIFELPWTSLYLILGAWIIGVAVGAADGNRPDV